MVSAVCKSLPRPLEQSIVDPKVILPRGQDDGWGTACCDVDAVGNAGSSSQPVEVSIVEISLWGPSTINLADRSWVKKVQPH